MPKMLVVTMNKTGHLVGAMTRNSNPENAPAAEELLPNGVEQRDAQQGTSLYRIPASILTVTAVDEVVHDALLRPGSYQLKDGKAELMTQAALALPANPVTASGVKVQARAPGNQEISVLLQPQAGGQPLQAGVKAPALAADDTVTVNLAVPPGDYRLAVWIQGDLPLFKDNITL